jgi:hypothetical protein
MGIKVLSAKERKPEIQVAQIPQPCTMDDATALEIEFHGLKRKYWSAKSDIVVMFEVAYDFAETDGRFAPGRWLVWYYNPITRQRKCEGLSYAELIEKYDVKGLPE